MLFVPLLYSLVGLLYWSVRRRSGDRMDAVSAAIMIVFWPMHVVTSDPPRPAPAEDHPMARLEAWLGRLERGPLRDRLLDAHAWAALAIAKGTPEQEICRVLRPLFDECNRCEQGGPIVSTP